MVMVSIVIVKIKGFFIVVMVVKVYQQCHLQQGVLFCLCLDIGPRATVRVLTRIGRAPKLPMSVASLRGWSIRVGFTPIAGLGLAGCSTALTAPTVVAASTTSTLTLSPAVSAAGLVFEVFIERCQLLVELGNLVQCWGVCRGV